jgi:glucose/arabinose dehydrogenase
MRTRRSILGGLAGLAAGLAGCAGAPTGERTTGTTATPTRGATGTTPSARTSGTTPAGETATDTATGSTPVPERIGAEPVGSGFVSPVGAEFPPGGGPGVVVDQPGVAYRLDDGGAFLDLRDRVVDVRGYDERGLLGIAFHPDYPENGRVFVRYSAPTRGGTPGGYSHTFVLAEFEADPAAGTADPASERTLLEIPEPQSNHNGGAVAFGPDGYLYLGVGDGGGAGDRGTGHASDWYGANPGGNGQDVSENLLGSVLRLDVDGGDPYAVPDDNPLVGRDGLDEQYAWGLRNPWRFSFDPAGERVADGPDCYVADVGQSAYEEVNLLRRGGNYGWNVREGAHCYDAEECPTATPDGDPLRDPVVEYPHPGADAAQTGRAVIGGYVYRRDDVPGLAGRYVFGDWQSEGELFVATPRAEGGWPLDSVSVAGDGVGDLLLAFGRDREGRLYACTSDRGGVTGATGAVHRLGPAG